MVNYVQRGKKWKNIEMYIKSLEGITVCENNTEGRNNNCYIISTELLMELHNYINLNMIGKPLFLMLIDSYYSFDRKHTTSLYIVVD